MKWYLRIVFFCVYVLVLIIIFFPSHTDIEISFHSCQEINCSYALLELLETYPNHYCAFYDLEDDVLYEAINEGVLFEDNYDEEYSKLQSVSSKGLMHHKFCVFDERYVLTGTWNPTWRGTHVNDNYILLIDSQHIADSYSQAYKHLLDRDVPLTSPTYRYAHNSLSLYFCPYHDCQGAVLHELSQAQKSVKILAFTFTDDSLAEELLFLSRKGIDIEVIYEKTRITRYSTYYDFYESAIVTLFDGNKYTMHEKMFIIDEELLILGSYNPTKSATTKNDENILIIDDPYVVQDALREYSRVRLDAVS